MFMTKYKWRPNVSLMIPVLNPKANSIGLMTLRGGVWSGARLFLNEEEGEV